MENISEYEIAQRRIEGRRRKKRNLFIAVGFVAFLILLGLALPQNFGCILPLGIIAIFVSVNRAIEYYYSSPQSTPSHDQLEQELQWLFGEDWQAYSGTLEYAFAQDRIRKRRTRRWTFLLFDLLFFMPFIAFLTYGILQAGRLFWLLLLAPAFAIVYILSRARNVFPNPGRLEKIEQKAGQELQRELGAMRPEKLKLEEKPKRDTAYSVGDDGELVELPEEILKHDIQIENPPLPQDSSLPKHAD